MPINSDDIEQGYSPVTPPEGDIEEQELPEPVAMPVIASAPDLEQSSKWNWIGSPDRPEAQETDDGISDLFEVPSDLTDTQDLISVDVEGDIVEANPVTGDLSDLVDVSEEDILGDEETGQIPLDYKPDVSRRKLLPRNRRHQPRYVPPTSLGRSG